MKPPYPEDLIPCEVDSYDVAIIGGGPAGSTVGALLAKYDRDLKVLILERETFPREHIGESLLAPVSNILEEMGCWETVEGANFPIKLGATYKWGRQSQLWDFDFFPAERFKNEPRPAKHEGQRKFTEFQVDRAIFDKILLDHARSLGCEVREKAKVVRVQARGDRVEKLILENGDLVRAKHYVDASGSSGILRRALEIQCENPTTLQNIAIYDYWQNADWAVRIGVGGTRIQILSLGYGWMWFIPLGPTRTSIGLVVPVDYYKKTGKRPEELYQEAVRDEDEIAELTRNAVREGKLQTTKDWSFMAKRNAGENWYLVGESAGFADPILSAGISMALLGAQQLACTILEIERGSLDADWLKDEFQRRQQRRISIHIRFADYWYTANKQLTELKEFTAQLARDAGLRLDPESAWRWIAQGGFIMEDSSASIGGFPLSSIRNSGDFLMDIAADSPLEKYNILRLNLDGADQKNVAVYGPGGVSASPCFVRDQNVLPRLGRFELLIRVLQRESEAPRILSALSSFIKQQKSNVSDGLRMGKFVEGLDAMIRDGWVLASYDARLPLAKLQSKFLSGFHWNSDKDRLDASKRSIKT